MKDKQSTECTSRTREKREWRLCGGAEAHTQRQCDSARARAKQKRGLKVDSSDYMVSLSNPKRSARSARPSASPTLPCPSARVPRVGRTAASHPYLRVVTAPVHKRSHNRNGCSYPAKYQNKPYSLRYILPNIGNPGFHFYHS